MALDMLNSFLRPAGQERAPEPALDDTTDIPAVTALPVPAAAGHVTYGRQAVEALRFAVRVGRRRWREEQARDGKFIHRMKTEPRSIQDVCDYADSRAWVPPGHDRGIAEKTGRAYFLLIGVPRVTYHRVRIWEYERPLRWLIWTAIRFAAAMAVLTLLGHGHLAAWITGAVLAAVVIAAAVLMPRRSYVGEDPSEDPAEEEDPE